jgi:hypothetical protein
MQIVRAGHPANAGWSGRKPLGKVHDGLRAQAGFQKNTVDGYLSACSFYVLCFIV